MKWAIQAKEEEKNKLQNFSADGWMGESKIFTNVVKKWARTPLSRAKNSKNKWAEWLGRGRGKGIRWPRSFVLVGDTNRDKRGAFYPGWWLQPGQKAPVHPLARLAVGPGTKATYYSGPKGCRDKWSGTNACFVVVNGLSITIIVMESMLQELET